MISSRDRSGWFGASDTGSIMGNWQTKTFRRWWLQKLGLDADHYTTVAMNAGTYYEHAILNHIGAERMDHQILLPEWALRVNLDGDAPGHIYEVKTHRGNKAFKLTKGYWQQVQVQCFAKEQEEGVIPEAEIIAYGLQDEDYKNFFREIDPSRLTIHPIGYDPGFIEIYLRRVAHLKQCLDEGVFPDETFD